MNKLFAALLALGLSGLVLAYNPQQPPAEALAELKTVNCASTPDECRYVAALEVLAFFHACPGEWARRGGKQLSEDEAAFMADAITSWHSLENPYLRAAVLAKENALRDYLIAQTKQYLTGLPAEEMAIECSRIAAVKDQHPAEEMSNLLWMARKVNTTISKLLEPPEVAPGP